MFLAALLVGIVALVVVSLLTAPEPAERIASFFERLQTSSDERRARPPQPLLLVNVLHPARAAAGRGWRAFREDLWGFALGWTLVVALVVLTGLWLTLA